MKMIIDEAIKTLHGAGKIPLIKFVRSVTFMGLKEAKDYVENELADKRLSPNLFGDFERAELRRQNEAQRAEINRLSSEMSALRERVRIALVSL